MKALPIIIGAPRVTNDSLPADTNIQNHDPLTEVASAAVLGAFHCWSPRRSSPYSVEVHGLTVSRELVGDRRRSRKSLENKSAIESRAVKLC